MTGEVKDYLITNEIRVDKLQGPQGDTFIDFGTGTMTIQNAKNIGLFTSTGTQLGTASNQKLGFWGATPVVQQSKINDPSGGGTQDAEARTAINAIIDALEATGMLASS